MVRFSGNPSMRKAVHSAEFPEGLTKHFVAENLRENLLEMHLQELNLLSNPHPPGYRLAGHPRLRECPFEEAFLTTGLGPLGDSLENLPGRLVIGRAPTAQHQASPGRGTMCRLTELRLPEDQSQTAGRASAGARGARASGVSLHERWSAELVRFPARHRWDGSCVQNRRSPRRVCSRLG